MPLLTEARVMSLWTPPEMVAYDRRQPDVPPGLVTPPGERG